MIVARSSRRIIVRISNRGRAAHAACIVNGCVQSRVATNIVLWNIKPLFLLCCYRYLRAECPDIAPLVPTLVPFLKMSMVVVLPMNLNAEFTSYGDIGTCLFCRHLRSSMDHELVSFRTCRMSLSTLDRNCAFTSCT